MMPGAYLVKLNRSVFVANKSEITSFTMLKKYSIQRQLANKGRVYGSKKFYKIGPRDAFRLP